jgi:hypothetical protein
MNKRLGLTGEQKVGLDILANRDNPVIQPSSGGPPKRDIFGFDKAHDEAFKKMDSIANHYAAKRPGPSTDGVVPGSKKRKSEALGPGSAENDAKRKAVITSNVTTYRNVVPGGFGDEDEELESDQRTSKRPRMGAEDKNLKHEQPPQVVIDEAAAKKAREIEAVRRKAEARRRSSRVQQGINTGLGRQSIGRRTSVVPGKNSELPRYHSCLS